MIKCRSKDKEAQFQFSLIRFDNYLAQTKQHAKPMAPATFAPIKEEWPLSSLEFSRSG